MSVLFTILIVISACSMGSFGGIAIVIAKTIKSKYLCILVRAAAIIFPFLPTFALETHAALWAVCAFIGLIVSMFTMAIVSVDN